MSKKHIPVKTQRELDAEAKKAAPNGISDDEPADADRARPAGSGPPESKADAANAVEAEASRLRAELDEARDRALRFQAELENYRRRVAREMEQERRYAVLPLLRDLLPVWDNVNRAIEASEHAGESAGLVQGVRMVAEQLEAVFRRYECVKVDALYQPFDPNFHEAITEQPSEEHPPGTVVGETQTGFRLHDRIVRPSQVIVSTAVRDDSAGKDEETD